MVRCDYLGFIFGDTRFSHLVWVCESMGRDRGSSFTMNLVMRFWAIGFDLGHVFHDWFIMVCLR